MSWFRGGSESTPPGHALGGFRVPGAALQMWERQVQNLVTCSCQEQPNHPQESCGPAPQPANTAVEDRDVPQDAHCVPGASQPELGFAPAR